MKLKNELDESKKRNEQLQSDLNAINFNSERYISHFKYLLLYSILIFKPLIVKMVNV
jgi:hypothetical protein